MPENNGATAAVRRKNAEDHACWSRTGAPLRGRKALREWSGVSMQVSGQPGEGYLVRVNSGGARVTGC